MDQEKKNLKGWRQNMMITKTVQKWLKTSRKTPQFNEDLRNFTTSRERRSKIITPLHNVIFDMVAQNFKIDNKEVVEGFLDSELNSDIMMSFFACGGMFAIHFTYGLFPPAPDSSGRYSSQEQRRQAALANRIIMTNTEFKELKESCVMIYRVKNTEHLNIRNYQDLVFSRYYGPLNEKETSLTRFTNDIEDFLKFDRMESVEKTIASSQEFSPVSPRTICKKLHSVVHDLKMIDNAIQKRPVFEIDQQLFKGFLVTDLMIEETLRIPEKVAEVEKIFTKWIKQFEEILVRGHQMYKHLPNADICHELQYWRDIVIQYSYVEKWIEEKEFTSVVKCLTMAGSSLITKWKDLRNQLHSVIIKTTDKCKFLKSIEIFFRDLSDQSPMNILNQLSGLIKLIKSSSNKICEFFGILNNQLVMFCVNFIEGNSEFFWQQDRAMLIEKINISRHLLNTFEETYMTLNNWECSQQHIFIEKTHFMEKINKIENVLNIIESFATLDRVRMSTMKEFNGRMKANFKEMISDSMSPLDKSYRDFDSRYTTFIAETNTIETEIYQMIRTIIAECPTSMHILLTINQYKRFNLRSLCINEHYLTVIEKLEGEFGEIFKKYEVTVTSDQELLPSQKIKYLRSFLASVEEPIKEIQDNGSEELEQALENCLSRRESIIFIFDTEEKTIFSNWCKTINQVHSALNEPVFVMDTNKPGYLVNFNEKIYLAIKEANSMLKLGFALSKEIKIILHCGENFLKNRDLLRDLTKRDRIVRESLPLIFVAIMTPQLRSLDLLFKKGRTTIAWTSSSLPSYIEELRSAIDSLSHHVKQLRDQKDIIDENLQLKRPIVNACKPSESERQYPKNVYGFIVERVDMAQIDEDIRLNIDTEVNHLIQDLYNDYEYLWTLDRFNVNKQIVQLNLTDLEIKEILEEISTAIKDAEDKVRKIFNYFPLRLSIEKAMKVIVLELWSWRADLGVVICRNIQQKINQSTKTVQELSRCIGKPIKDVKDIPKVFECLKTIRSSSFVMRQELDNISEILTLLQQHDIEIIDSDLDAVYQLNKDHKELLELEVKTRKTLLSMAEPLIENLKLKISTFEREWSQFELDYQESGPIIPTIAAKTASDRLFIFTTRFDDSFSEYLTIQSGVNVFGLTSDGK
ncbi:hypothetical protein DMENIID0001_113730 [Sergentomyia squamirostris]